jgi:hypothetical protein
MRTITKGSEPKSLRDYRAVPGATYDGKDFTRVKNAIRKALLRDQHHVCCYCMRRISDELRPTSTASLAPSEPGMKVEHWYREKVILLDPFGESQTAWKR